MIYNTVETIATLMNDVYSLEVAPLKTFKEIVKLELLSFKFGFRFLKSSIFTINIVLAEEIVIFPPKSCNYEEIGRVSKLVNFFWIIVANSKFINVL